MKSIEDKDMRPIEDTGMESVEHTPTNAVEEVDSKAGGDAAGITVDDSAAKSDKPKKARRDEALALSKSRTSCSLDRTLLAWVRTCLHLIVFGFILYKFIQSLASHGELIQGIHPGFPKMIGLSLVILGVAGLITGIVEYLGQTKKLKSILDSSVWSASLVVAVALAVIGASLLTWLVVDLI